MGTSCEGKHRTREGTLLEPLLASRGPPKSVRRDGRRLRLLSFLMLAVAVAIAIVGLVTVSAPAVLPVLLFGTTMVAAEHRDRLFGDETSVSGSIAVAMATVLVFARGSWLDGTNGLRGPCRSLLAPHPCSSMVPCCC